jgi:hypothetical protein
MPAPRRFSHEQENLILALSARGLSSTEIAALCAQGTPTVDPFEIPDRTVRSIIQRLTRDRPSAPRAVTPRSRRRRNRPPARVSRPA